MPTVRQLYNQAQHELEEAGRIAESKGVGAEYRAQWRVYEQARDAFTSAKARETATEKVTNHSMSDYRNVKDAALGTSLGSANSAATALNGRWPDLGSFLKDISPASLRRNGEPAVFKDLSEGVDSAGGYLVPAEHLNQLLMLSSESEIVRPRAFTVPANSDSLFIPRIDETTHAGGAIFGGVSAAWTAEGATLGDDDATYGQLPMTIRKLTLRTVISNELMADASPALSTIVPRMFSQAMAWALDVAFIGGDGATEPLGALSTGNPALISESRATGGTILWDDVVTMFSRLVPGSASTAVWLAHPSTLPKLATMVLVGGTTPVWMMNGAQAAPPTLLGRPVIITEHMAALGTAGDIALVDFQRYVIADRASLSIRVSEHEKFSSDQTVIRGTLRLDGRPWMSSALTPENGSTTLSSYIRLAT